MSHYHNGKDMPFSTAAIPRTLVYALEVDIITGKRKACKIILTLNPVESKFDNRKPYRNEVNLQHSEKC